MGEGVAGSEGHDSLCDVVIFVLSEYFAPEVELGGLGFLCESLEAELDFVCFVFAKAHSSPFEGSAVADEVLEDGGDGGGVFGVKQILDLLGPFGEVLGQRGPGGQVLVGGEVSEVESVLLVEVGEQLE